MLPLLPRLARCATLLLPALLLAACATPRAPLPPVPVPPPAIPPLPPVARQARLPTWCLPTCSAALQIELSSWQQRLTSPTPPAAPASGPTGR